MATIATKTCCDCHASLAGHPPSHKRCGSCNFKMLRHASRYASTSGQCVDCRKILPERGMSISERRVNTHCYDCKQRRKAEADAYAASPAGIAEIAAREKRIEAYMEKCRLEKAALTTLSTTIDTAMHLLSMTTEECALVDASTAITTTFLAYCETYGSKNLPKKIKKTALLATTKIAQTVVTMMAAMNVVQIATIVCDEDDSDSDSDSY